MAVNESRSMRRSLLQGATDGSYKSLTPGRDGEVESTTNGVRSSLKDEHYDRGELPLEVRHQPGGERLA